MFTSRAILTVGIVIGLSGTATAGPGPSGLDQVQQRLHDFEERRTYDGLPLTLRAALDEALKSNPTLVALRSQFEVLRLRPAQEHSLAPPTFEAQIWQWPISTANPRNTNMYMFTIAQELPGGGKRQARAAVVEKEAAVAENDIAVNARRVLVDVKQAYANLFITRKHIDVHLEGVEQLRQFADVTEAKYVTGRISQQDVLKAIVELSRVHDDPVMMEGGAALAEAQLNTLLGRSPEAPIGSLEAPREQRLLLSSSDLQRMALDRHPELRAAALERERAQAAVSSIETEYKPDFIVGGGYMMMPRDRDAWTASVGVTWPKAPWARDRADSRVAEAKAGVQLAVARQHEVTSAIRLAVQEAYVRVQAATQRAALLRTSVLPQSGQTLEVSRVAYQSDRVNVLTVIDNQRALFEAQLEYYGALNDFEQAVADLERAIGAELDPAAFAPPAQP